MKNYIMVISQDVDDEINKITVVEATDAEETVTNFYSNGAVSVTTIPYKIGEVVITSERPDEGK